MLETNKIYQGDCLEILKGFPDRFLDCCVTSPPYYGLRDYGCENQIGLEETPEDYIAKLVKVFREVRRCLKDDGTLWVNIGDSYNGAKKGNTETNIHKKAVVSTFEKKLWNGAKPKDLIGIPWMLAFALRADGWYLRQDIIWSKPSCMPEPVKDRCTKSHEYIFLLSKSQHYHFNYQDIQERAVSQNDRRFGEGRIAYEGKRTESNDKNAQQSFVVVNEKRNKRDVWSVSPKPIKDAHVATYPEELIEPCILAGSDRGGVVLDPFFGSGTTGRVAERLGRQWVGIELNPEYVEIARKRTNYVQIQMF